MGSPRYVLVVVLCALLLAPVASPASGAGMGGLGQFGGTGIEPDGVFLRVDLRADGTAEWAIDYRVRLDDENTTTAFESLREDIEANRSAYTTTFASRMRDTAAAAEDRTGREMAVRNVTVSVDRQQLPQEYGVLTYEFEWTAFAAVDGDRLRAGDALAGLFLDRSTTLVVSWPSEFTATSVQPEPDERRDAAVVWLGPTEFGSGQPSVVLAPSEEASGADGDGGSGGDSGSDGESASGNDGGDGPSLFTVAGGALVAVLVGAVGWIVWTRRRASEPATDVGTPAAVGAETTSEIDVVSDPTDTVRGDETGPGGSDVGEDEADAAATADVATDAEEANAEPWDDELLSNEERVTLLLDHEGGRMKQQEIASTLEWSDAKTSQVIGKMRESDRVETFRLGRENVVSLPGDGEP